MAGLSEPGRLTILAIALGQPTHTSPIRSALVLDDRALVLDERSQLAHRRPRFGITSRRCATEVRSNARSPRRIVGEITNDVDCSSVRNYLAEQNPTAEFPAF